MLHPLNHFPVQRLLNGDMSHRGRRRSAVPMLLVRRKPDDIARPDFLDWSALALHPAATGCDNQSLTERMRMPRGASTRLERNACAGRASWSVCLEQGIDAHRAGKPISRSFAGRL